MVGVIGRAAVPKLSGSAMQRDVAMADDGKFTKVIDGASACLNRQPSFRRPSTDNSDDFRIDQLWRAFR